MELSAGNKQAPVMTRVIFVGSNKVGILFYGVEYRRHKGEVVVPKS